MSMHTTTRDLELMNFEDMKTNMKTCSSASPKEALKGLASCQMRHMRASRSMLGNLLRTVRELRA